MKMGMMGWRRNCSAEEYALRLCKGIRKGERELSFFVTPGTFHSVTFSCVNGVPMGTFHFVTFFCVNGDVSFCHFFLC